MEAQVQVVTRLRAAFRSGLTVPEQFRRSQLLQLVALLKDNEEAILTALHSDLRRPKFESVLAEIEMVSTELHHALSNLSSWMKPQYVDKNLATKLDDCFVRREPVGLVLVVGPWNYPLQLLLLPLVAAIAAGNCVILKPSEISAATDGLIAELLPRYLHQDCYAVVSGGAEETSALLTIPFDHIFYTGSQAVARLVLQAAAVHLTPVTLELGGKCPCFIHDQVDVAAAARRLAWSKFFNAGQSCVAPDFVLCSAATRDALLPALRDTLQEFYSQEPQKSPHLSRIVSPRHCTRLTELLEKTSGKVVIGGESDPEDKYIAPTVVVDVAEDDALMKEEIFGPILPIVTVESVTEGIDFINRHDKPLALYVFSDSSSVVRQVLEKTSSGGFCSNDGIVHMTLPGLPFGGVGASGWGKYHGRWGFETFSHQRACMLRGWALERLNGLRYPPYSEDKLGWLRWTTSPKSCVLM
ncbi:aldehyde dehydrogenase family 3 member B1 [Salarias fasciatus]|uniref:Aldehyde dehydrogenase n=1 Tax=Salarias fasciatus TaxID=181472 RepID=A0A672FCK0_SALFA|nr:aldehyde dehydrogenase family 3 member B1-like [Salarias fasciatus]